MRYKINYICTAKDTDFTFMVSIAIEIPFHPNSTDAIFIYDDFHEINRIELMLDKDPIEFAIELDPKELCWQGSLERTLEHMHEEQKEMIENGWELESWYSRLPDMQLTESVNL